MITNTNKTKISAASENRELTDDELNAVSGGIIFVGGEPPVTLAQNSHGSGGGGGAGKVILDPFSHMTDSSSPNL